MENKKYLGYEGYEDYKGYRIMIFYEQSTGDYIAQTDFSLSARDKTKEGAISHLQNKIYAKLAYNEISKQPLTDSNLQEMKEFISKNSYEISRQLNKHCVLYCDDMCLCGISNCGISHIYSIFHNHYNIIEKILNDNLNQNFDLNYLEKNNKILLFDLNRMSVEKAKEKFYEHFKF